MFSDEIASGIGIIQRARGEVGLTAHCGVNAFVTTGDDKPIEIGGETQTRNLTVPRP
jgi:hypothetical protein